ncbi:MAG: hypothetical protein WBB22_14715, partial [Anaerolineae bacterium]
ILSTWLNLCIRRSADAVASSFCISRMIKINTPIVARDPADPEFVSIVTVEEVIVETIRFSPYCVGNLAGTFLL